MHPVVFGCSPRTHHRRASGLRRWARCGPIFVLLLGSGCAFTSRRIAYTPAELRAEVAQRTPELSPGDVVVPFEVDPRDVARARRALAGISHNAQVRPLVQALFSPAIFGLHYAPVVTATARETLRDYEGNCLSLASVFVGLARSLGFRAYYLDASARLSELSQETPGLVVNSGHITAAIEIADERWYLDFDRSIGHLRHFRVLDDLEALAHFYNNRGYERIEVARLSGESIDWEGAAKDFTIATRIEPSLARAWNNLGIALARLGHRTEAEAAYERAIATAPRLAAPYNNLGALYLGTSRPGAAVVLLRKAVELAPKSAHFHYNLGRALLASGDRLAAKKALERAADLRDNGAERLLGKIALYEKKYTAPPRR